jgi:hypothetical protein
LLGLKIDLFIDGCGREDVVANTDVVGEDALQLGRLGWGTKDLVLLESFKIVDIEVANDLGTGRLGLDNLDGGRLLALFEGIGIVRLLAFFFRVDVQSGDVGDFETIGSF